MRHLQAVNAVEGMLKHCIKLHTLPLSNRKMLLASALCMHTSPCVIRRQTSGFRAQRPSQSSTFFNKKACRHVLLAFCHMWTARARAAGCWFCVGQCMAFSHPCCVWLVKKSFSNKFSYRLFCISDIFV